MRTLRDPSDMVGRCYRVAQIDQRLARWGFKRKDIVQVTGHKPDSLPPIVFVIVPGFPDQTSFIYAKWLGDEVHPLLALASTARRA